MLTDSKWENLDLDAYRQLADPEVDRLAESILSKKTGDSVGRLGYNSMLMLADKLEEDPELITIANSRLRQQLNSMPENLIAYFEPMEAPDWVDVEKLKSGSKLWQDNTLMTLISLYAASLPACYLMKNGIPALYQTGKLSEPQYLFQRIYETGLMLSATMDQEGIRIIEDTDFENDKLFLDALQHLDAGGRWQQQEQTITRTIKTEATELDALQIKAEIERIREQPKRYICGKGFITVKKVRFLHASMRYMLTHPVTNTPSTHHTNPKTFIEAISQQQETWDLEKYGVPVNQEDLAYTLLTFGLLIPQALEKFGMPITAEEKDAFLHLWRLVGHMIGVHSELLTDNRDEAQTLFTMIKQRQAGKSEQGMILTDALMGFLDDYLPYIPGVARRFSAALIISQLGQTNSSYLLDETLLKETTCFWRKPIYALGAGAFKLVLYYRTIYLKYFSNLGWITTHRLHEASELLIDSWRGAYTRKPFFVPANATNWVREPGVDKVFMAELKQWRRKLFLGIGVSVGLLGLAVLFLTAALPGSLFWGLAGIKTSLVLAGTAWVFSLTLMQFWLPKIFKARPQTQGHSVSL